MLDPEALVADASEASFRAVASCIVFVCVVCLGCGDEVTASWNSSFRLGSEGLMAICCSYVRTSELCGVDQCLRVRVAAVMMSVMHIC